MTYTLFTFLHVIGIIENNKFWELSGVCRDGIKVCACEVKGVSKGSVRSKLLLTPSNRLFSSNLSI